MRTRFRLIVLLAAAVLTLLPAAGTDAAPRPIRNVSVGDNVFAPVNLAIKARTRVRWTNNGVRAHTSTSNSSLWDDTMAPRETFTRLFSSPGTFRYRCTIHSTMTGTITVTT